MAFEGYEKDGQYYPKDYAKRVAGIRNSAPASHLMGNTVNCGDEWIAIPD